MAATRIPIKFLELHEHIFIGAKNYPPKIDAEKQPISVTRYMNGSRDEIHFVCGKVATIIPFTMVKQAQPFDLALADIELTATTAKTMPAPGPVQQGKVKAQVSAPNGIKI